ncbi:MAG: ComEC/Rec2 family competence protein [Acetatifactor sp.]|nr:ComEC/Rec2 family competence protein [Acetatifactor sp.]
MKRPLFWVCITLAVVAVLKVLLGGMANETVKLRQTYPEDPPWEEERITFQGKVVEKGVQGDQEYFLLSDLSSNQDAAASRQIISILQTLKTDRIQCFLATEPGETLPKIGSRIQVEGLFSFFETATNPGEFDYAKYYQGKRIGGKFTETRILWQSASYDRVREFLHELKIYFGKRLDYVFPVREAGVMRTMLLGDRTQLDPALRKLYQEGGIVHILSISGLHVTLLGMGLYSLLRRLGMRMNFAAVLSGGILVLYGIMTGMSVSACRAIGMFLLRMLALTAGRTYDLPTAVAVMACGMLCTEPVNALNSGFWLSFGSILGVGVTLPVLEKARDTWRERSRDDWKKQPSDTWVEKLRYPWNARPCDAGKKSLRDIWRERPQDTWVDRVMAGMAVVGEGVLRALRAGLAIFLTTLPLSLWFYYEVPTYSTLLNLIVIPLMGPLLLFGMLAMLIPGLGILGTVDVLGLRLFEKLCLWARELPFSSWNPGCPRVWQMITYYAMLSLGLWCLWMRSKKEAREKRAARSGKEVAWEKQAARRGKEEAREKQTGRRGKEEAWEKQAGRSGKEEAWEKQAARSGKEEAWEKREGRKVKAEVCKKRLGRWTFKFAWLLIVAAPLIFVIPARRMTGMTFLDVGQGDCVFIRLENGQTWLYDCGSTSRKDVGEKVLIPFLKHEGIHHLDGIFLSHGDRDHVSGITELLESARQEGIRIDQLYLPNWERAEDSFSEVLQAAKQPPGTQIQYLSAGDALTGKNVSFLALHPQSGSMGTDGNEDSLCLWVCLKRRQEAMTALLTGDVQGAGEKELLEELRARDIREVTVLKCAHHGSQNATSPEFLNQMNASITVISCGRKNVYGHPHEELLRRLFDDGTTVLRTDRLGAITLRINKAPMVYVK